MHVYSAMYRVRHREAKSVFNPCLVIRAPFSKQEKHRSLPSSNNIPFIPPKDSQTSSTATTHQNSQRGQDCLCPRNITPGFSTSGPNTNGNCRFDFSLSFKVIGPFEDIFVCAVIACYKEEGGGFFESREEMRTGRGFCKCCWFGNNKEFALDGMDRGRT